MLIIIITFAIATVALVFSILAFLGKGVILDDAYLKATDDERKDMNKRAYSIQAGIVFLLLSIITALNGLRGLLHMPVFTYVAFGLAIGGILYAIVSHYSIKKK